MEIVVIVGLVGSALIHAVPLVGVLGPARVARMYDVGIDGADLRVLLVHRAVLFGVLAGALVWAVFLESARPAVVVAVAISDLSFLVIAALNPGINSAMKRVMRADVVSIALLAVAGVGVLVG
ncbi:MAG: hypothetical protein JWQ70_1574 [Aeromicrobium sp.]|nr:hypothetical protein [Aeromicrobium sp.]